MLLLDSHPTIKKNIWIRIQIRKIADLLSKNVVIRDIQIFSILFIYIICFYMLLFWKQKFFFYQEYMVFRVQ